MRHQYVTELWKWKVIGTLVAILGSIYLLVPSFFDFKSRIEDATESGQAKPAYTRFFPDHGLNLGLDLRGGIYLEMAVDLADAVKTHVDLFVVQLERTLQDGDIKAAVTVGVNPGSIHVELVEGSREKFLAFLDTNFRDTQSFQSYPIFRDASNPAEVGPSSVDIAFSDVYLENYKKKILKQSEGAVTKRIDRYGVVEASIQSQGGDRLVVELPGVKNPERVVDVIRKTGKLEFRLVNTSIPMATLRAMVQEVRQSQNLAADYSEQTVAKINQGIGDKLPKDTEVLFELERHPLTKEITSASPFLVSQRVDVAGDMLQDASVGADDRGPHVRISFNRVGTKNFAEVTQNNVGGYLAIILDGFVISAPQIETAILGGDGQITMGFGSYDVLRQQSEDLALLLREGALPAKLTILTKTVIGPSLGLDSIRRGLLAMLISAAAVMVFMGLYYKLGGLLATAAVIINVLLIFAILSLFQASLTLPGMAGIVLTLGMAVDANILIFERMKEEKRLGRTAKTIVESGYGNAMSAIIDSNITTLIAGVVLFQFGTGPIKGFATTLMVGIMTTLFTAIVVTRLVYDYFIYQKRVQKIII